MTDDSNVGTFLEELMKDDVDRRLIRMISQDKDQDEILDAMMQLMNEEGEDE